MLFHTQEIPLRQPKVVILSFSDLYLSYCQCQFLSPVVEYVHTVLKNGQFHYAESATGIGQFKISNFSCLSGTIKKLDFQSCRKLTMCSPSSNSSLSECWKRTTFELLPQFFARWFIHSYVAFSFFYSLSHKVSKLV